jgi:hypothetical protein
MRVTMVAVHRRDADTNQFVSHYYNGQEWGLESADWSHQVVSMDDTRIPKDTKRIVGRISRTVRCCLFNYFECRRAEHNLYNYPESG